MEQAVQYRRRETRVSRLWNIVGLSQLPSLVLKYLRPILLYTRQHNVVTDITFGLLKPDTWTIGNLTGIFEPGNFGEDNPEGKVLYRRGGCKRVELPAGPDGIRCLDVE